MSKYISIGQAASILDISVETIRYYEKEGIIPSLHRDTNNYRLISLTHLLFLKGVTQLRHAGFSLEQIKQLHEGAYTHTPDMQFQLITQGLDHVKENILALEKIQADLMESLEHLKNFYSLQSKGCHVCNVTEALDISELTDLKFILSDNDFVLPLSNVPAQGNLFLLKALVYKDEAEIDTAIDEMMTYCDQNSLIPIPAIYLKVLARPSYYTGDQLAAILYLNLEGKNEYTTRL